MTVEELLREARAGREARFRYAHAYDRFMAERARYLQEHKLAEAQGAMIHASIALRAYLAEQNDPEPRP